MPVNVFVKFILALLLHPVIIKVWGIDKLI